MGGCTRLFPTHHLYPSLVARHETAARLWSTSLSMVMRKSGKRHPPCPRATSLIPFRYLHPLSLILRRNETGRPHQTWTSSPIRGTHLLSLQTQIKPSAYTQTAGCGETRYRDRWALSAWTGDEDELWPSRIAEDGEICFEDTITFLQESNRGVSVAEARWVSVQTREDMQNV